MWNTQKIRTERCKFIHSIFCILHFFVKEIEFNYTIPCLIFIVNFIWIHQPSVTDLRFTDLSCNNPSSCSASSLSCDDSVFLISRQNFLEYVRNTHSHTKIVMLRSDRSVNLQFPHVHSLKHCNPRKKDASVNPRNKEMPAMQCATKGIRYWLRRVIVPTSNIMQTM